MKDISNWAGVPKGSFYNHFESKEALAIVALERSGVERHLEDFADTSVKPLDRLRGHFEFLRDEVVEFGYARGCLLGNVGTEIIDHTESIRASVQEGMQRWADLISGALTEAQQAGTGLGSIRMRRLGSCSTPGKEA
ncbi:MAG: TetR/AcrR family transcriptional regulator, transcriptional repressor for nem operon [Kribbellaceae bacterium]|nr:TetR/AcrR family transcriptional regulator, transcriptional repressor for nem operon [Kribbellaceae bacterium]